MQTVTSPDYFQKTVEYFLVHFPEVVGVALATTILASLGWVADRILRQKKASKNSMTVLQVQEVATAQYFSDLIRRGSTLSFGDPASWTVSSVESEGLVTLDEIWTPLRVADSQIRKDKRGTHENMAEAAEGTDLKEVFKSTGEDLLILGDPGSGKSTSVGMFAVEAARRRLQDKSSPLPVWVGLATITSGGKDDGFEVLLSGVRN